MVTTISLITLYHHTEFLQYYSLYFLCCTLYLHVFIYFITRRLYLFIPFTCSVHPGAEFWRCTETLFCFSTEGSIIPYIGLLGLLWQMSQTGQLKQQNFILSKFWRLEVPKIKASAGLVSPCLADGHLLPVSSYAFSSVCACRWCLCVKSSPYKDPGQIGLGPALMASL